jgi:hypothetical protein
MCTVPLVLLMSLFLCMPYEYPCCLAAAAAWLLLLLLPGFLPSLAPLSTLMPKIAPQALLAASHQQAATTETTTTLQQQQR